MKSCVFSRQSPGFMESKIKEIFPSRHLGQKQFYWPRLPDGTVEKFKELGKVVKKLRKPGVWASIQGIPISPAFWHAHQGGGTFLLHVTCCHLTKGYYFPWATPSGTQLLCCEQSQLDGDDTQRETRNSCQPPTGAFCQKPVSTASHLRWLLPQLTSSAEVRREEREEGHNC